MTEQAPSPQSWTPTADENARTEALVSRYVELERRMARDRAEQAGVLVALARIAEAQSHRSGSMSDHDFAARSMAAEIGAAARIPDGTIRNRMAEALTLVTEFPLTYAALRDGRISDAHARAIVAAGERIVDDGARAEYEAIILHRAETTTVGQLRSLARAVAERVDPLPLTVRQKEAMAQRGVWITPMEDGMAELRAMLPAFAVYAIHDRLTQMAAKNKTTGRAEGACDSRTLDHHRADLFADLLLTGTPTAGDGLGAIRATVQITIPADTVTGVGDDAAFLAGYGPVDPASARRMAGAAHTWVRLFRHPDTGALLTVDAYTPTAAQRRFLAARDEHCRFPGCRQPARRCDIDHTVPYSRGGPTVVTNTSHLCEAHHRLKHHTPWAMRLGSDGITEFVSPTGRVYVYRPAPMVRFDALAEVRAPGPPGGDAPPF